MFLYLQPLGTIMVVIFLCLCMHASMCFVVMYHFFIFSPPHPFFGAFSLPFVFENNPALTSSFLVVLRVEEFCPRPPQGLLSFFFFSKKKKKRIEKKRKKNSALSNNALSIEQNSALSLIWVPIQLHAISKLQTSRSTDLLTRHLPTYHPGIEMHDVIVSSSSTSKYDNCAAEAGCEIIIICLCRVAQKTHDNHNTDRELHGCLIVKPAYSRCLY